VMGVHATLPIESRFGDVLRTGRGVPAAGGGIRRIRLGVPSVCVF